MATTRQMKALSDRVSELEEGVSHLQEQLKVVTKILDEMTKPAPVKKATPAKK